MVNRVRNLQAQIADLCAKLRILTSKQVSQKDVIGLSRNIVDYYFIHTREFVLNGGVDSSLVAGLDKEMQTLLGSTHKRTTLILYKKNVNKIRSTLVEMEKLALLRAGSDYNPNAIGADDQVIIDTLTKVAPSAALSYQQALIDMQSESRLSWRGPATDFREALRECLDHLAPDNDVESQSGFKLQPNTSRPTMKQKVKFILKKRKLKNTVIETTENSVDLIEEIFGSFTRSVYARASISTHTHTARSEVNRIHDLVRFIFREILSV